MPITLYDMHAHIGFVSDVDALIQACNTTDIAAFCVTVEPMEFERLQTELKMCPQFRVGLGLHPWWVAEKRINENDVAKFEELAPNISYIGEIGLDFAGWRGKADIRAEQKRIFERELIACGSQNDAKLISLHAVHATTEVLNTLEQLHISQRHTCIFHWFSGSLEELKRALKLGCFFSVNTTMLQTKRGITAAQNIPLDRLLIETDKPSFEGDLWDVPMWLSDLENTLTKLSEIREEESAYLKEHIALTCENLFKK